jgi:hypothetical protein
MDAAKVQKPKLNVDATKEATAQYPGYLYIIQQHTSRQTECSTGFFSIYSCS